LICFEIMPMVMLVSVSVCVGGALDNSGYVVCQHSKVFYSNSNLFVNNPYYFFIYVNYLYLYCVHISVIHCWYLIRIYLCICVNFSFVVLCSTVVLFLCSGVTTSWASEGKIVRAPSPPFVLGFLSSSCQQ